MTSPQSLDIARRLHALGLSVIPVPLPRAGVALGTPGDGKVPAFAWKPYQFRLPTADEIDRWFAQTPMNLAVVTGAISGVVVVDADDRDALQWCTRRLPYTPWQTITARGFHLWYRHPGVVVRNKARIATGDGRLAIDVRGDGGYVVAPGSQHASGGAYHFAGDWSESREHMPEFCADWLVPSATPSAPTTSRTPTWTRHAADLVARARAYLAAVPVPEVGCGSDVAVFTVAARLVRGFNLSVADAEDVIWQWVGGRSGWTREWVAQKVAHAARYGTEAIGARR